MTDLFGGGDNSDVFERFGYDLNAAARRGDLEPVRCRDAEIARIEAQHAALAAAATLAFASGQLG